MRGWVEAPVATLKTGNDRRDRDLNKSMESDKYPTMRFDLDGGDRRAARATACRPRSRGDSRSMAWSGRWSCRRPWCSAPDKVRVRSDFPLNLKDYKIGGLTKLMGMLRMYEDIKVHVDVTFHFGQ